MKKNISVSNLTLDLYLDYVRPAARAAGILEEVHARDDWHEFTAEVTEETAAAEIAHCMTVACFNANKDGEERTHEQFVKNEARQMLYQMEVSMEYRHEAAETIKALYDAMTAMLTTAPAEEQTTETETETEEEEEEETMRDTFTPAEAAMHAATVRGIIRRQGGYRERDILNHPHTVERGETWNEAHKVVEILSTMPEPDGYRPGCAVDLVTRSIVG